MLVRLDKSLAPAKSSVNREGTLLRIEWSPSFPDEMSPERVIATVSEMGYFAEVEDAEEELPVRWFGTDEVRELSEEEARVLSERWVDEMLIQAVIPGSAGQPVRTALYDSLLKLMTGAAETGEVPELVLDPVEVIESAGISDEQARELTAWIRRKLGSIPSEGPDSD